MNDRNLCRCGSGNMRSAHYDARGIFLAFTCAACHADRMKEFRPDVLNDPNYWANEPIEADY